MKKIHTNELSNEAKKSMTARIITGAVIAAVSLPCLILGSWPFFWFILVITLLSAYEITHITDLKNSMKFIIGLITVILTVCIVYYIFYRDQLMSVGFKGLFGTPDILYDGFKQIDISVMLVIVMFAVYFIISFLTPAFSVKHVFYFVTMILVVSIGVQSFMFLRYSPAYFFSETDPELIKTAGFKYGQSLFFFLYVVIGVVMNDIGAYFIGVLFGKHKMNERISPKKTWEGFIGGVVFSFISSISFALLVTYLGKPMLPIFNFNDPAYPYAAFFIAGISIILPLIADTGDFTFSAVKRYWGVKDFSKILPGHGGILDRLDSLIFSAALVASMFVAINFFFL